MSISSYLEYETGNINYISITVQTCQKTFTKKDYKSICLIEYGPKGCDPESSDANGS